MAKTVLIKNANAIVTCDPEDHVYSGCDILIEGPSIVKIEKKIQTTAEETIDASGKFIYPGLVNTHHHFFQTFIRNLASIDFPNLSVLDWLEVVYEVFKHIDADLIYYSSLTAMADLLKHGATTVFDHQYVFPKSADTELIDRQMDAASRLGLRFHAGRGSNTLPIRDGSNVPDEMCETTDEFLQDCERLIHKYHDPEPYSMRQVVVSPCQPINCYKETFIESAQLAREHGVLLHTHLGEGENGGMVARYGMRTLAWCEEIGFVGPDVWVAHGWELTPEEYRAMADTQTGLSHCPAPAALGGFPIIDIPAMASAGMRLSLGCDGSATNDGSNLLDSLRMAYVLQTLHGKERGGSPSPYQLLKIATAGGAEILGRNDIGSLEPGKCADLFMIDTERLEFAGALHDPANMIPKIGATGPVWLTMVNGEIRYQDDTLVGVDESQLAREAESTWSRGIRKHFPADSTG
jgi:hydroxydechloroatrazine ethylaminohydrolase